MAARPPESLLLHRDRRRAFRGREAGRQGLADVALLGPWLQVRRADGQGARPHHRLGARSGPARALGSGSRRRYKIASTEGEETTWLPASAALRTRPRRQLACAKALQPMA